MSSCGCVYITSTIIQSHAIDGLLKVVQYGIIDQQIGKVDPVNQVL